MTVREVVAEGWWDGVRRGAALGVPLALWVVAVSNVEVSPDLSIRQALGEAAGAVVLVLAAVVAARFAPGIRSWADLGLARVRSTGWMRSVVVLAVGSVSYVAVSDLAQRGARALIGIFDPALATVHGNPAFYVPDPQQIPADLARTLDTSLVEEILLFGFPIALAAIFLRCYPDKRWVRVAAVLGAAVSVVGLRMLGHSYWGSLIIAVVPWMAGAWIIYRICGTVWPLLVGHIVFDVLIAVDARLPWSSASTIYYVTVYVGLVAFIGLIAVHIGRRRASWLPGRRRP